MRHEWLSEFKQNPNARGSHPSSVSHDGQKFASPTSILEPQALPRPPETSRCRPRPAVPSGSRSLHSPTSTSSRNRAIGRNLATGSPSAGVGALDLGMYPLPTQLLPDWTNRFKRRRLPGSHRTGGDHLLPSCPNHCRLGPVRSRSPNHLWGPSSTPFLRESPCPIPEGHEVCDADLFFSGSSDTSTHLPKGPPWPHFS